MAKQSEIEIENVKPRQHVAHYKSDVRDLESGMEMNPPKKQIVLNTPATMLMTSLT